MISDAEISRNIVPDLKVELQIFVLYFFNYGIHSFKIHNSQFLVFLDENKFLIQMQDYINKKYFLFFLMHSPHLQVLPPNYG